MGWLRRRNGVVEAATDKSGWEVGLRKILELYCNGYIAQVRAFSFLRRVELVPGRLWLAE